MRALFFIVVVIGCASAIAAAYLKAKHRVQDMNARSSTRSVRATPLHSKRRSISSSNDSGVSERPEIGKHRVRKR